MWNSENESWESYSARRDQAKLSATRRMGGDWSNDKMMEWVIAALMLSLVPVSVFALGAGIKLQTYHASTYLACGLPALAAGLYRRHRYRAWWSLHDEEMKMSAPR